MVETGRPSRHPLWTANRWDPTPSSHINARDASVCSSGSSELVFTPTMGESWERRRLLRAAGKKQPKWTSSKED